MPRPMLLLAAGIALGAFVGDDLAAADAARLLAGVAVLLLLAVGAPPRAAVAALLAAAFGLGAAAAAVEHVAYDRTPLRQWVVGVPMRFARLQGVAREDGAVRDGALVLVLEVDTTTVGGRTEARAGRVRLRVNGAGPFPEVTGGDRVAVWAELRSPASYRNPGSVDLAALFRRQGVHAVGSCKSARLVDVVSGPSLGPWSRAARDTRRWAHGAITAALPDGPERAVVLAMTLGEQSAVDPDTAEAFRVAGTYHVLALSGAQVALVAGVLLVGFRRAGLGAFGQAVVVSPVLGFYAAVVGAGVSIVRATAMALLAVWGRVIDADVDVANVLGAAAAALLLLQPSLVSDVGFELTFAATLGILLWTPVLEPAFPRVPRMLARLAAASLAAQIALLPILAAQFHRLSPAALLLNLAAVPLSSLVLAAGAVVVGAAAISSTLAVWTAPLAFWSARLLLISGEVVRAFPWLDMRVPGPGVATLFLYAAGAAVLPRRPWAGGGLMAVAVLMLCRPAPITDGRLRVTVLDVGQGDAIVVETPAGRAFVVDAGGAGDGFDLGEQVVAPYLWERGITRLHAIAVSHAHLDHVGGVPFLMRHFAPGELWEGPAPLHDRGYAILDGAARHATASRRSVGRGASATIDGVRFDVLGPKPPRRRVAETRNDDSLVIRVTLGSVSFLLTGDVESAGEEALRTGPVTMLKIAHHGSRTSSSGRFLDAVAPRVAVLSVGARNHFGHPSPEILQRVAGRGVALYRTDRDGAVTLVTDGRQVSVETFTAGPGRAQVFEATALCANIPVLPERAFLSSGAASGQVPDRISSERP